MSRFELLTTWRLEARRQAVWDTLADVHAWPDWWPGLEQVIELEAGDARRVGSRYATTWRGPAGYRVRFEFLVEEVDEPLHMAGSATGDLRGTGVWRLAEEAGATVVTFDWRVDPARGWMRALSPLMRPLVLRGHDRLMDDGGEALARLLRSGLPVGG